MNVSYKYLTVALKKYALNYVQMLTRMPYTSQNNEAHKYFRSVCLTGGSWEDESCSLFSDTAILRSVLFELNMNKELPIQGQNQSW